MQDKNNQDRMGIDRIGKLLFQFCLPAIASVLVSGIYNIIDTAFLGQALPDGSGVAVMTLTLPVNIVLNGLSMLAGAGGNALAAIQLGEGKRDKVELTMGNTTLLLCVITALSMAAAMLFMDEILLILGTPQELWEQTATFVWIYCMFSVFSMVGFGILNFTRTAGRPMISLSYSVLSTVACIVFNYIFVLQLGWGVAGSAYATVLGQAFMFVPVIWFFTLNKKAPFYLRLSCFKPDFPLIGRILALGLASFITQTAATVVTIVLNHVIGIQAADSSIGVTGALAAIGVANKISYFTFMPTLGIMIGSQPLIGYNHGAQKWSRVIKLLKWACWSAVITGACFFVITHVFPHQLVLLFGVSAELGEFAAWALQWFTIWVPVIGYQAVAASYFQSSGQPLKSTILELARQVLFLTPFYLFMPDIFRSFGFSGIEGVVFCVPMSDVCATILTTFFVISEVRKLRALRAEERARVAQEQLEGAQEQAPDPASAYQTA